MDNSIQGKSGTINFLKGIKVPQMYSCLPIEDITFAFSKSFFRPARAVTLAEDVTKMRLANPSDTRFFIFGHTDNVNTIEFNKHLSDRRARSIFSFLTHDYNDWLKLHEQEGWGRLEIQEVLFALSQKGARGCPPKLTLPIRDYIAIRGNQTFKKNLLQLYKDYMEHFVPSALKPETDFCKKEAFSGCSELNPLIAASLSKDREVRNLENEPNRRVVIFLIEQNAIFPCKEGSLESCFKFKYKTTSISSNLFLCEFYDKLIKNGKCPNELKVQPPQKIPSAKKVDLPEIEVSVGFPASVVEKWILEKYKTQPEFFTKILEPFEVNNNGKVVAVLKEEIDNNKKQRLSRGREYKVQEPFCLVKTSVYYLNNEYFFKAEVIVKNSGEKLFEEFVHAPRMIGIEGYWQQTGKYVWRHIPKGNKLSPGYKTEYKEGLGIDSYLNDLYLMLCTERKSRWKEFPNITERVKEIMRQRGYKVK